MTVSIEHVEAQLRQLPPERLALVHELVTFLEGLAGAPEPKPEDPKPEDPKPEDPPKGMEIEDLPLAMMLRFGFGALDVPEGDQDPGVPEPPYKRLPVPPLPQEKSLWCWAATVEMIAKYHGRTVTQVQQTSSVNDRILRPEFKKWGFDVKVLPGPDVLTEAQVQEEIDQRRPFAISWKFPKRDENEPEIGHVLVIGGYVRIRGELWLVAYDPWPPGTGGGDRSLITYDHYVGGLAGPYETYYGIRPIEGSK